MIQYLVEFLHDMYMCMRTYTKELKYGSDGVDYRQQAIGLLLLSENVLSSPEPPDKLNSSVMILGG